jgi:hypothetical protein
MLYFSLGSALLFSGFRIKKSVDRESVHELIIYSIRKEVCFAIVNGRNASIWASKTLIENKSNLQFHVLSPLKAIGVKETKLDTLPLRNIELRIGNIKMTVLQNEVQTQSLLNSTVVYFTRCRKCSSIGEKIETKHLILQNESVNTAYFSNAWDLETQGAFVLDL